MIDNKKRPKFEIDEKRIKEFLRGSHIYSNKYSFIREILQNAVDATVVRVWLDLKANNINEIAKPNNEEYLQLFDDYPIEIIVKELSRTKDIVKSEIIIKDSGTGISRKDLDFMLTIGGSYKNTDRKKIINEIPIWMRPAGAFGIGLQSVFLYTTKIKIHTKSMFTMENLELLLTDPEGYEKGNVFIKKSEEDIPIGTKVIFEVEERILPDKYSISGDDEIVFEYLNNFDPFSGEASMIETLTFISKIITFMFGSIVPIKVSIQSINKEIQSESGRQKIKYDYFSEKNAIQMLITPSLKNSRINFKYRGQNLTKNYRGPFKFWNLNVNLLKDKADRYLSLNREQLRTEIINELYKEINVSLIDYLCSENGRNDIPFIQCASAFFYISEGDENNKIIQGLNKYNDEWKNIDIDGMTISEILEYTLIQVNLKYDSQGNNYQDLQINKKDNVVYINGTSESLNTNLGYLLVYVLRKNGFKLSISKTNLNSLNSLGEVEINFQKSNELPIIREDQVVKNIIKYILNKSGMFEATRISIPSIFNFETLYIMNIYRVSNLFTEHLFNEFDYNDPRIVLPFVFKTKKITIENLDKLIEWTYKNRSQQNITYVEIEKNYKKLIKYIDTLMDDDADWKQYRI